MDLLGYSASCAVLATFLMRTMTPLRLIAILSNVLFLSYGYVQHIYPVFFLHVILLPINSWRLLALQFGQRSRSLALRPAYASRIGSKALAPWFLAGLLAGLIGPLTVLTASAEPARVRVLADHLMSECQSKASSLVLRLIGKPHGVNLPDPDMGSA